MLFAAAIIGLTSRLIRPNSSNIAPKVTAPMISQIVSNMLSMPPRESSRSTSARFHTPIRAPGEENEDRAGHRGERPLPSLLDRREVMTVLDRDQRCLGAAKHEGDLDRSFERVEAEQRERPRNEDGQGDQREGRIGERRRADVLLGLALATLGP